MEHVTEAIKQAEHDLVETREELRIARELVISLEQDAKRIEIELVGLRSYAQRRGLADEESVSPLAVRYLNRLSDALFVMARQENHRQGVRDVYWDSKR